MDLILLSWFKTLLLLYFIVSIFTMFSITVQAYPDRNVISYMDKMNNLFILCVNGVQQHVALFEKKITE